MSDMDEALGLTAPSELITLQVGEQRFNVTKETLSGSKMLEAKISGRWDSDKQSDGSYFVDADPEIFKPILRFLRHGVYPLYYGNSKGHEFGMYTAIQELATYLIIPKLTEWLSKRQYLRALAVETSAKVTEDEDELRGTYSSDSRVVFHPTWRTVKKYVCPRGIGKHYDNPSGCGRACRAAQGVAEDEYEDCPVLSTLVITSKTVFDQQLCVEEQRG
ncbi:MAG: hypothetical protein Q9166_006535 [cf. Caloplaca sp. 2 TL-2023]